MASAKTLVNAFIFYLPVSLTTVAVYAGRSMSYNSAFHLVLFAVLACWAVHTAAAAARGVPWDRTPEELGP